MVVELGDSILVLLRVVAGVVEEVFVEVGIVFGVFVV